jgi:hypothetical protein
MIDYSKLKGKFINVSYDVEMRNPQPAQDKVQHLFIRGKLDEDDDRFIQVTDARSFNRIIKKADIVSCHQIEPIEVVRQSEKSQSIAVKISKSLDERLRNFQETQAKKDIEWLDKKVIAVRKDLKKDIKKE